MRGLRHSNIYTLVSYLDSYLDSQYITYAASLGLTLMSSLILVPNPIQDGSEKHISGNPGFYTPPSGGGAPKKSVRGETAGSCGGTARDPEAVK